MNNLVVIIKMKYSTIFFFLLIFSSCHPFDTRLNITNQSKENIYYEYSWASKTDSINPVKENANYYMNVLKRTPFEKIEPKDTSNIFLDQGTYDNFFKEKTNNLFCISVYNADALDSLYRIGHLENAVPLQTYCFRNVEELKKINWLYVFKK
jgi:hypothetical protein